MSYNKTLFKFTGDSTFSRVTDKGGIEWTISLSQKKWRLVGARFHRLFFVNKNGGVVSYDATYGYKLWGPKGNGISQLMINYPTMVAKTRQNQMIAIDFFSGHILWKRSIKQDGKILLVSKKHDIILSDKTGVFRIDLVTGKEKTKLPIKGRYDTAEDVMTGILFQKNKLLVFWSPSDNTVHRHKIEKNNTLIAKKGKIGVVYNKIKQELVIQDLLTKEIKWHDKLTDKFTVVEDKAVSLVGIINHKKKTLIVLSLADNPDNKYQIKRMDIEEPTQLKGIKKLNNHILLIYPKKWIRVTI